MPKLFVRPQNSIGQGFPTMQGLPVLSGVPQAQPNYTMQNVPEMPSYQHEQSLQPYHVNNYAQSMPVHTPMPPNPMTSDERAEYYKSPKKNLTHAFLNKAKTCINCTHFLVYVRGSDGEHLNLCKYRGVSPWNDNFTCAGSYCSTYCETGKETSVSVPKTEPPKKRKRRSREEMEAARKPAVVDNTPKPVRDLFEEESSYEGVLQPINDNYSVILARGSSHKDPPDEGLPPIEPKRDVSDIDSKITFGGNKP